MVWAMLGRIDPWVPKIPRSERKRQRRPNVPWCYSLSYVAYLLDVTTFIVNFIIAILTMGSLLLRLQRVGPNYHAMTGQMEPFFPWLLEQVNATSKKYVGIKVIPEWLILNCEEDAARHDTAVKRVGLNGYMPTPSMRNINRSTTTPGRDHHHLPKPPQRAVRSSSAPDEREQVATKGSQRQKLLSNKGHVASNGVDTSMAVTEEVLPSAKKNRSSREERNRPFQKVRSQKNIMIKTKEPRKVPKPERALHHQQQQQSFLPTASESSLEELSPDSENLCVEIKTVDAPPNTSKSRPRKFPTFRRKKTDGRKETHPSNNAQPPAPHNTSPPTPTRWQMKSPSPPSPELQKDFQPYHNHPFDMDNHNLCNTCGKKYKFPKRCRHHCARCGETFCHKHGRTTHNNFVSCKVPGDCVCNVCLSKQ